jgi:hypothetical protein
MEWRVSAPKPTPPAITRRWHCEFRGIPVPRSMRHTVGDGSPHAVEPIHQIAVVVIPVPEVEDEQNNQRGHEYAHLTSLLPAVQLRQPSGRPASACRSSVCRSCRPSFLFRACCREWLRHHVEKKRSVVGLKQRLTRDVPGPRLRINAVRAKNDRRSLEVRRPSFGRTPKRRSGRPPPRQDFTCTFRAGLNPRRRAVRDAAHPHSKTL